MRKLIKKTIIIVVMMLSINIGIGLWLQHQVTLSLEKEASLQHVAVDLALMMASESRMERSMTALGEDPKKNFQAASAQVIQMKALSHVQLIRLESDATKAWGNIDPLKNLIRNRNESHSTSLQIVNLVRNHHEAMAPLLWNKIAHPAFSHYVSETRIIFADISRQINKLNKSVTHRRSMQTWVQILTLIAWAIALFLDFRMLSAMATRLEKAATVVNLASKRDLTELSGVDGKDEAGEVGRSIDRMIGELSGVTRDLNANARSITRETDHLSAVLEAVSKGFLEAVNTLSGVQEKARELAEKAAQETLLASEMGQASKKAVQEADTGGRTVQSVLESVRSSSEEITSLANRIAGLEEASQKIGAIAGSISAIAAQTNLLALNAAIEAARAGEQGRGFAVVADEVRKLAQTTTQATEEISAAISSIQGSISETVTDIRKEAAALAACGAQAVAAEKAIDSLARMVRGTGEDVEKIVTETEIQKQGSDRILEAVVSLSKIMEARGQDVSSAIPAVEHLRGIVEELSSLTSSFRINTKP